MSNDMINANVQKGDISPENNISEITEELLADVRSVPSENNSLSIPIAQLATLGSGVASLLPALRTVTKTTTTASPGGLYRLLNDAGNGLKQAKDGSFWGATVESKMGKFEEVKGISKIEKLTMPIDPTAMMMAVALASIEKQLDEIIEMQKQILSFLETEKESEIEGDVETLVSIINNYKYNWDNAQYTASNHKLVLDIQRTARKNMISYQKKVSDILNSNQFIIAQSLVKQTLTDLLKKFKYYRLSLYSYSLASLIEIMLSKNFKEDYVREIKSEIEKQSFTYREIYDKCSLRLEKMTTSSVETNVLKGIGTASKAVGGLFGNITFMKGSVDKFLNDSGDSLKKSASNIETDTVKQFAEVKSPNTMVFIDKMDDIIRIYNHTEEICFDNDRIYLITG